MAITVTKNGYKIARQGSPDVTESVVADSVLTVAKLFEDAANPLTYVALAQQGIKVVENDVPNPVTFATVVTPDPAAGAAGCKASPSTFTVEAGTEVIFEATLGTGYGFVGWFIGGVGKSVDLIASLAILAPAVAGQTVQVEARFVAVP